MAMISPRDLYLRNHPTLAAKLGDPAALRRFLTNNPGIASGWQRVMGATRPTLNDPRTLPETATPSETPPVDPRVERAESEAGQGAYETITALLAPAGLDGVAKWAWDSYLDGKPLAQIMLELRTGQADPATNATYKTRFPGIQGSGLDEAQYIQAERGYQATMRAHGLPADFYDGPEDFGKLIAGKVSEKEVEDRVALAAQVVATDPRGQQMRDQLGRLYGLNDADGLAIAYWIDPGRGADLIKRQFMAAQSAATSERAGFGSLSKDEAERVGAGGYAEGYLAQQFSELGTMDEFLTDLPGGAGDKVTRDDLIAAGIEQNADAKRKVEGTRRKRQAQFEGGGGFAAGEGGVTGLGSANN